MKIEIVVNYPDELEFEDTLHRVETSMYDNTGEMSNSITAGRAGLITSDGNDVLGYWRVIDVD